MVRSTPAHARLSRGVRWRWNFGQQRDLIQPGGYGPGESEPPVPGSVLPDGQAADGQRLYGGLPPVLYIPLLASA